MALSPDQLTRLERIAGHGAAASSLVNRLASASSGAHLEPTRDALISELRAEISSLRQSVSDLQQELAHNPRLIEMDGLQCRAFRESLERELPKKTPVDMSIEFGTDFFQLYASNVQVVVAQALEAEYQRRGLTLLPLWQLILDNGGL